MREIKFRAWEFLNKEHTEGQMVDWEILERASGIFRDQELGNIVLMQSTGLKDKNGVEIFEGDIVAWDFEKKCSGVVQWYKHSWLVANEAGSDMYFNHPDAYMVIGNIYETPNLARKG